MNIEMTPPLKAFFLGLLLLPVFLFSQEESRLLQLESPRMNGKDVQELQQFLLYQGYWLGEDGVDGWFGPDTAEALRAYQREQDLAVTGSIRILSLPRERSLTLSICPFPEPLPQKQPSPLTFSYGRGAQPIKPPLFDPNNPADFRTYFGQFRYATLEAGGSIPFSTGVLWLKRPNGSEERLMIDNTAEFSPCTRYLFIHSYDSYANLGSMGITIWDTLSAEHFSIDYSQLPVPEVFDLGLRDSVYRIEYQWIGDQELLIKPYFDYQQIPAHPGHDGPWHTKLGELAGRSDPVDTGWYLVEIQNQGLEIPAGHSWFFRLQ
jgi:hypothetical protein